MTRGRSVLTLLLVAFALVSVLGHICVLPGHAHAASAAEAHDHDHATSDEHGAPGDGVHAASCDVLRPSGVVAVAPVLVAMAATVAPPVISGRRVDRAVDTPPPTTSPPLYLVHRALLI